MSLYQASEAMYQMSCSFISLLGLIIDCRKRFDKVMVLYEGREIFFDPVDGGSRVFVVTVVWQAGGEEGRL